MPITVPSKAPRAVRNCAPICLTLGEAGLDEQGEITYFVWDLVEENGDGGSCSDGGGGVEGGGHGEAVGDVVGEVGDQVQIPSQLNTSINLLVLILLLLQNLQLRTRDTITRARSLPLPRPRTLSRRILQLKRTPLAHWSHDLHLSMSMSTM